MRITQPILKAAPILVSVLLYSLAFPPANLFLLVFVALVPWLSDLQKISGKEAFRSGLLFGVLFWLFQLFWLVPFVSRWTHSIFLGSLPWLLAPFVGMWYFGAAAWLMHACFKTGRPWLIPFCWSMIEVIRAYMPGLAFPWGFISTPLAIFPQAVQHASFGTQFLVSAWVVAINVVGVLIAVKNSAQQNPSIISDPSSPRSALGMTCACVALLLASGWRYLHAPQGKQVRVAAAQLGVDLAFGEKTESPFLVREAATRLIGRAAVGRAAFVVLPEGLSASAGMPPNAPFPIPPPIPVIFGGARGQAPNPVYQSAFGYDGKWHFADKTRLVVFGEYVPMREYLPFLKSFDLPEGDLTPAEKLSTLELGPFRIGPILCFEGLFPDIASAQVQKGAQVLVQMSIDDWYIGTNAPEQLFDSSIWRAIESGVPLVRSAELGHTAIIDARGNVLAHAKLGNEALLLKEITIGQSDAFKFRWIFPWICVAGTSWTILELIYLLKRKQ